MRAVSAAALLRTASPPRSGLTVRARPPCGVFWEIAAQDVGIRARLHYTRRFVTNGNPAGPGSPIAAPRERAYLMAERYSQP